MQIILIRHGESTANAASGAGGALFTGQYECELTPEGRHQAEALAGMDIFSDVDAYFSSDLKRAVETAECFADKKIIIDPRLRERSLGVFEGKNVDEVRSDPQYEKYFTDPEYIGFRHDFRKKAPGGENYRDVCNRVRSFLDDIFASDFKKIVIISHMCAIRCFMHELYGLSEEETLRYSFGNCIPITVDTDTI